MLFRNIERVLLAVGLTLCAAFLAVMAYREVGSRLAVRSFQQATRAESGGSAAGNGNWPDVVAEPDYSLWASKRIAAYRDSLMRQFAVACRHSAHSEAPGRSGGVRRNRRVDPEPGSRPDHRDRPDRGERQYRYRRTPRRLLSRPQRHCGGRHRDPVVVLRHHNLCGRPDRNRRTTGCPRAGTTPDSFGHAGDLLSLLLLRAMPRNVLSLLLQAGGAAQTHTPASAGLDQSSTNQLKENET